MKRWSGEIIGLLIVTAAVLGVILWPRQFALSSEYAGKSGFEDVTVSDIRALVGEKKSFAVLVTQPECRTSEDLEKILQNFGEQEEIVFLKTPFGDLKDSGLIPELKYYPSVVIYHDGKVADFLKANDDNDTAAYTTEDGFREWWSKYVKMKK